MMTSVWRLFWQLRRRKCSGDWSGPKCRVSFTVVERARRRLQVHKYEVRGSCPKEGAVSLRNLCLEISRKLREIKKKTEDYKRECTL